MRKVGITYKEHVDNLNFCIMSGSDDENMRSGVMGEYSPPEILEAYCHLRNTLFNILREAHDYTEEEAKRLMQGIEILPYDVLDNEEEELHKVLDVALKRMKEADNG